MNLENIARFKQLLSLLHHQGNLKWRGKMHQTNIQHAHKQVEELQKSITDNQQKLVDIEREQEDTAEALAIFFKRLHTSTIVELMTAVSYTSEDEMATAAEDYRPSEVINSLIFNGGLLPFKGEDSEG